MDIRKCSLDMSYGVTIDGRFWRFYKHKTNELKIEYDNREGKLPYGRVKITIDGVYKKVTIHRLVAEAFLPAPTEENCEIDHIDNNPQNNHASNLRWVSRSVNLERRRTETMGRHSKKTTGEHLISKADNRYRVYIKRKDLYHLSSHETLEEAVAERDRVLS